MDAAAPGFFGKMPGRGDFVTRRLNRGFLDAWDAWLQAGVADSKSALGSDWLNTYLTSPLWRFVVGRGVCGNEAWSGVMMPSVDRVGRYFPLAIAAPCPPGASPFNIAQHGCDWFERAEALILTALEEQGFDLDAFDGAVGGLGGPVADQGFGDQPGRGDAFASCSRRIGMNSVDDLSAAYGSLLDHEFEQRYREYSIWWTSGSELVAPSLAVCPGLPPAEAYASLLTGQWRGPLWMDITADGIPSPATSELGDVELPA